MARYIVTYDLVSPGQNYEELHKRIKSYGTWAQLAESSWAIMSNQTAVEVRDHLKAALDSNDRLLVGRLGSSAWIGLKPDVTTWLKRNSG